MLHVFCGGGEGARPGPPGETVGGAAGHPISVFLKRELCLRSRVKSVEWSEDLITTFCR